MVPYTLEKFHPRQSRLTFSSQHQVILHRIGLLLMWLDPSSLSALDATDPGRVCGPPARGLLPYQTLAADSILLWTLCSVLVRVSSLSGPGVHCSCSLFVVHLLQSRGLGQLVKTPPIFIYSYSFIVMTLPHLHV